MYFQMNTPLVIKWSAWQFRAKRADYYSYLSDILQQSSGKKTLRDIFDDDSLRYEQQTRGRLAGYWCQRYQENGGDLVVTFQGTVPEDDLLLLRLYQQQGGGSLSQCFADLSRTISLVDTSKETFLTTCAVGMVAILVAVFGLAMIPFYTVPKLRQAFSVPDEFLGSAARRLFVLADYLNSFGWIALLVLGAMVLGVFWSLANFTHPLRQFLDQWSVWRLYRSFHAIRFLSALAVLTKTRVNLNLPLKEALLLYQYSTSVRWLRNHLERMVDRVEQGFRGVDVFKTGLVDQEVLWFMEDMVDTSGLEEGLKKTEQRVSTNTLRKVARQATWMRWCLLIGALLLVFGIAAWHIVVVQEMKNALLSFHAGR